MVEIYDIYGFLSDDIEECRKIVEQLLQIKLCPHENSSFGDYYRAGEMYGEEFILQQNFDELDEVFQESQFKDYKTLFFVNLSKNADKIRFLLENSKNILFLERRAS